jgi:hypothetical protein
MVSFDLLRFTEQLTDGVVDLFSITDDHVKKSIRYHEESRRWSIIDVISLLTGKNANDSARVYKDMLKTGTLQAIKSGVITKYQFPGRGQRDTPVAPASVMVEFVMLIPGNTTLKWRLNAVQVLCRALGGDLSLVKEIEERHNAEKNAFVTEMSSGIWTPLDQMDFSIEPQDNCPKEGVLYIAGSPDVAFLKVGMWTGTYPALLSRYKTVYGRGTWVRRWESSDVREDEKKVLFALSMFSRGGELIDLTAYDFAVKLLNHNFEETVEETESGNESNYDECM